MTARRALRLAPLAALLALGAAPAIAGKPSAPKPAAGVRHPEDLFIVDCLLPGKVRSLGRYNKIATPRKVVRTSAHECGLRGGEWSQDLQDNAWALQSWQAQAEAGDAEAMNNVGEIYEQGVRGAPDYTLAAAWYRKAAEAGSRRGQRNLAALYEQGLGVEASDEQAVAWYRKAAGLTGEVELSAEREAAALRAELEKARAEAAAAQGELARLQGELDGARAALAAAEQSAAAAKRQAASAAAAAAQRAKSAEQLAVAEAEVTARKQRVAELEGAQDRFRTMLAELEASEQAARKTGKVSGATLVAKRAPAIEFVRPDVLATRGPALAPVEAGAREAEVVGRVTAELGLASFTVDGRAESLDAQGYFRVRLPVRTDSTVRFVALDRAARRAEAELRFVAQGAPPAPGPPPGAVAPPATAGKGKRYALVLANGAYRSAARAQDRARRRRGAGAGARRGVRLPGEAARGRRLPRHDGGARRGRARARPGRRPAGLLRRPRPARRGLRKRGYWLPVDADPAGPHDLAAERRARAAARHGRGRPRPGGLGLLLCGHARGRRARGEGARRRAPAASRTVLASGGLQPVLDEGGGDDHSIFARALLSVLQLARGATPASPVASAVAARVGWKSAQLGAPQTPRLRPDPPRRPRVRRLRLRAARLGAGAAETGARRLDRRGEQLLEQGAGVGGAVRRLEDLARVAPRARRGERAVGLGDQPFDPLLLLAEPRVACPQLRRPPAASSGGAARRAGRGRAGGRPRRRARSSSKRSARGRARAGGARGADRRPERRAGRLPGGFGGGEAPARPPRSRRARRARGRTAPGGSSRRARPGRRRAPRAGGGPPPPRRPARWRRRPRRRAPAAVPGPLAPGVAVAEADRRAPPRRARARAASRPTRRPRPASAGHPERGGGGARRARRAGRGDRHRGGDLVGRGGRGAAGRSTTRGVAAAAVGAAATRPASSVAPVGAPSTAASCSRRARSIRSWSARPRSCCGSRASISKSFDIASGRSPASSAALGRVGERRQPLVLGARRPAARARCSRSRAAARRAACRCPAARPPARAARAPRGSRPAASRCAHLALGGLERLGALALGALPRGVEQRALLGARPGRARRRLRRGASTNSSAEAKRSSGLLASARRISARSAAGTRPPGSETSKASGSQVQVAGDQRGQVVARGSDRRR